MAKKDGLKRTKTTHVGAKVLAAALACFAMNLLLGFIGGVIKGNGGSFRETDESLYTLLNFALDIAAIIFACRKVDDYYDKAD